MARSYGLEEAVVPSFDSAVEAAQLVQQQRKEEGHQTCDQSRRPLWESWPVVVEAEDRVPGRLAPAVRPEPVAPCAQIYLRQPTAAGH